MKVNINTIYDIQDKVEYDAYDCTVQDTVLECVVINRLTTDIFSIIVIMIICFGLGIVAGHMLSNT